MDTCVLREFKNSSLPLCCQISFIRIPDFNNQELNNLGKPIIVFPILEKARTMPQDDVFGYFMNGGVLDSVTMSAFADMDNEDDFYQWFVGRIPNCNADWKDPGCDNDGICEPQFGETELNCEDCQNLAKTGPGVGRLYLWSITSLEDKRGRNVSAPNPEKRFQEWHYNGKYEIGFQYAIHNTQTQKIDYQFVIDDANVDTPYRHDADILKEFSSWGNPCQVKRSKKKLNGSWVSNNGVSTTETFGQGGLKPNGQSTIMSNNFLPMIDEVYFVLYEKDWEFTNPENIGYDFGVYINRGPGQNNRMEYTFNPQPNNQGQREFNLLANEEKVFFIDNDPGMWNPIAPINGKPAYEYITSLDGEWQVKFVYIEK